jgi:hypothetical protein
VKLGSFEMKDGKQIVEVPLDDVSPAWFKDSAQR